MIQAPTSKVLNRSPPEIRSNTTEHNATFCMAAQCYYKSMCGVFEKVTLLGNRCPAFIWNLCVVFSRQVLPGKYEVCNGKQLASHLQPRLRMGQASLTRGLTSTLRGQICLCLNCLHSDWRTFSLSLTWLETLPGRRRKKSFVSQLLSQFAPLSHYFSVNILNTYNIFSGHHLSCNGFFFSPTFLSQAYPPDLLLPFMYNCYHSSNAY